MKRVDGRFHLAANELQCLAVDIALMFDLFEQRLNAEEPHGDPRNRLSRVCGHQLVIMTIVHVIVICWLT